MTLTAGLPMYNPPEMRAVNARFWEALRGLLVEAALRDLPESLSFDRLPVPECVGPEVLFSQTCGYPLETIFSGQAVRLGTPCYDVRGCDGPTHCGLFIVPTGHLPENCAICAAAYFYSTTVIQFRCESASAGFGRYCQWPSLFREGHRDTQSFR